MRVAPPMGKTTQLLTTGRCAEKKKKQGEADVPSNQADVPKDKARLMCQVTRPMCRKKQGDEVDVRLPLIRFMMANGAQHEIHRYASMNGVTELNTANMQQGPDGSVMAYPVLKQRRARPSELQSAVCPPRSAASGALALRTG